MRSFATRYVYYATMMLGLLILLSALTSINYYYQSPQPPPASGNIPIDISSYNVSLDPHSVINYAESGNFTPLNNLTKDNLIPILKEKKGQNITTSLKEILSRNASLISPMAYWEAIDLAQFLNASPTGYTILHSYSIPLSPNENESWTQNYLTFNISKFNVTVHNNTYTPSTNISYSLSIINESTVILKNAKCIIWDNGTAGVQFNEIGFCDVWGHSYKITTYYPYIWGNYIVFVPAQEHSTGLIYFTKNLYINNGGINISLIGGATQYNTEYLADGWFIGIAENVVTSWTFNPSGSVKVYGFGTGGQFVWQGNVAFPSNRYAIIVEYDAVGPNINFYVFNGSRISEIVYTGIHVKYYEGNLIYFRVSFYNGVITAYVKNLNTASYCTISVSLSDFGWYPNFQPGLYTIYIGGTTGSDDGNWNVSYIEMNYSIPTFIQNTIVTLQGHGYTYNGTNPITWLQNNTKYYVLRYGDGAYTFSLKYFILGNKSYSEFVKVFTNDTLKMIMRYYNLTVNRNYTGLVGWINATPSIVPNQYGGLNYTPKFLIDVKTFPVPDYVVIHPPQSAVFKNNYAFEYLEWAEYSLLAQKIYNYSIQFTENVTQHLGTNYTQYWRAEAYAIAVELVSHDLQTNISAKYQHAFPIEALWDGNGTQYEANINVALILESLMPVNMTIGEYYNITSYSPITGYWVQNWSYDYVNVMNLPPYWINNTVFLQYNYTYLTDIAGIFKYFTYWQIPNGSYNNVVLYNPLPTTITFHYGTYYLNLTPIEFYNVTTTLQLMYNDQAEYKTY